jgi:outer membrane immunogenic protein
MKKLLFIGTSAVALAVASSAVAADLGVRKAPVYKALPPAPVAAFSWTGCHIGAHVGGGWGFKEFSDVAGKPAFVGSTLRDDVSGVIGGGQIGCDYQMAPNWVVGIEGSISAGGIRGDFSEPFGTGKNLAPSTKIFRARTDWLASATGRIGYAWNQTLFYAKGGAAWARDRYHADETAVTCDLANTILCSYDASETRFGWTVGGGLEWAFLPNWSVLAEYDFYGFGKRDITMVCSPVGSPGCGGTFVTTVNQQIHTARIGLNFRFNAAAAPVAAKY